jgi:putative FmdB family regulatory protein
MPIYAYRCEACGFAKDVLQKMSDAPLTECTACGKPAFKKQLTAAGFQLKGSGWYVTDFRGGQSAPAASESGAASTTAAAPATASGESSASKSDTKTTSTTASTSTTTASPSTPTAT